MRNLTYDLLPQTIQAFKNGLAVHNNTLQKSNKFNVEGSLEKVLEEHKDLSEICKSLYSQFSAVRKDYVEAKIPVSRYRHNLSLLKDLLTNSGEKITNENLHASEIVAEIKKHLI